MKKTPTPSHIRPGGALAVVGRISLLWLLLTSLGSAQGSWTLSGLSSHITVVQKSASGDIYALSRLDGLFRSTDNGTSWSRTSYTGFGFAMAVKGSSTIFVTGINDLSRSTDGGATWTHLMVPTLVKSLVVTSAGDLLAGTSPAIYRSDDDAASWEQLSGEALPQDFPDVGTWGIAPGGEIFAGTGGIEGGHICLTPDGGDTWQRVYTGVLNNDVTALGVSPAGRVFAAVRNIGILYSDNMGGSWPTATSSLDFSFEAITSFAFTPERIIAGYTSGALTSTDNGATWTEMSDGLPSTAIIECQVSTADGKVLAGTSAGVYSYSVASAIGERNGNAVVAVDEPWPNPATGRVSIGFSLATSSHVRLTISDELGREVATIIDERRPPGSGSAIWETENAPAGTYFVRIVTGDAVTTRRVVVAR